MWDESIVHGGTGRELYPDAAIDANPSLVFSATAKGCFVPAVAGTIPSTCPSGAPAWWRCNGGTWGSPDPAGVQFVLGDGHGFLIPYSASGSPTLMSLIIKDDGAVINLSGF